MLVKFKTKPKKEKDKFVLDFNEMRPIEHFAKEK